MNHIDLQNILFLDIETVSGEPNFDGLSGDMQELWANKTKWQHKEDITAKEYKKFTQLYFSFPYIIFTFQFYI